MRVLGVVLMLGSAVSAWGQLPAGTREADDTSREDAVRARIADAEGALQKGDFKGATVKLKSLAVERPKDAQVSYDLGYAEERGEDEAGAAEAYARAIADDPTMGEPRVALGLGVMAVAPMMAWSQATTTTSLGITGGGSEILTEDFRARHSKFKYTVKEYFEAQGAIVAAGLKTTATMVIGFDESIDERLEHLERTRQFQDETGGLASFLCWTFKPYFTQIGGIEISTAEYLRHLALCRIYLDNVPRIRTSVLTQNQQALGGLSYGADDFDLPIEDEVTQKAGATISLDFEKILNYARELGFEPAYRHVSLGQAAS